MFFNGGGRNIDPFISKVFQSHGSPAVANGADLLGMEELRSPGGLRSWTTTIISQIFFLYLSILPSSADWCHHRHPYHRFVNLFSKKCELNVFCFGQTETLHVRCKHAVMGRSCDFHQAGQVKCSREILPPVDTEICLQQNNWESD